MYTNWNVTAHRYEPEYNLVKHSQMSSYPGRHSVTPEYVYDVRMSYTLHPHAG